MRMNRRQFIETVALGVIAAPVLASTDTKRMPTRPFGRTGLTVPILGFGAGSRFLMYDPEDKALDALNRAIDLGITYIDTANDYGRGKSEERIGKVMATRRKEVVLATKLPARTADEAKRQIEQSLKRLRTDHLDVLHIHELKSMADLAKIEAKGGVLEALREARDQKITRAIGVTCHADPVALKAALERNDFDCTQMALNAGMASMKPGAKGMKATPAGKSSFEELALPVANQKKLGVIAMKVFGQEQLLGAAPVDKLLAYSLSLPVSVCVAGMPKLDQIEHNAQLACSFTPMPPRERRQLEESIETSHKLAMAEFFRHHADA
jgi:aryl-alcohol dehydrogenase-like predicted oxidoreductase